MKRCQNCSNEILYEDLQYCEHCGADLRSQQVVDDDRLDFEVSECHDDSSDIEVRPIRRPLADTLGIQTSAELVQNQTSESDHEGTSPAPSQDEAMAKTDGVQRLSADEIKNIEKHLYSSSASLSTTEKQELIRKMADSGTTPAKKKSDAQSELPRPMMAKRGRSIAYYVKNFVQLQGEISLHEEDELIINDRVFVLRKKPLTPKAMISVAAGVFVVLALVFIPLLVRDAHVGQGEIIGVVLDASHQPYTAGATVRFPETGQSLQTDGEGFFRTGHINPGTHRIEYVVNNQVVATDYATVAAGDVTTLSLEPGETGGSQSDVAVQVSPEAATSEPLADEPVKPQVAQPQIPVQGVKPAASGENGKITLAANIEGAKFQVDGVTLGAGNLTYNRIKPGVHSYTVAGEGYQAHTGSIEVRPGQTEVLAVALTPMAVRQPGGSSSQYDAAMAALKDGRVDEAVAGFSSLLAKEQSNAAAYMGRGDAYALGQNKSSAHDDYLRAAEIYRIGGSYGDALTAFNKAVTADPKSPAAYLERADLYLARHEEIAAIADYESVLKLDKKSAPALIGIGEARFSQGNYKQAIKYFKDAKSLEPNNAIIYQYLMLCYMGDDDLKNVRKSYDRFKEVATQEQLVRMHSDREYGAVLRVVQGAE